MKQIIYVSDNMKQSIDFINNLISDLKKIGIENIGHDRERNYIIVGDIKIRGICIYESCLCLQNYNAKYFIDGIDMKKYENASDRQLDNLIYHIKEIMLNFKDDTKQLPGKDELIEILMEGINGNIC